MGLGREKPSNQQETFCMTVLGPPVLAPRQCCFRAPRRSFPCHVDRPVSRASRKTKYPSGTSPMEFTFRPGSLRRCFASTTAILGTNWHQHSSEARIWEGIENVDDGELWETHLSLKSQLLDFVRRRAVEQAERRARIPGNFTETRQNPQLPMR